MSKKEKWIWFCTSCQNEVSKDHNEAECYTMHNIIPIGVNDV